MADEFEAGNYRIPAAMPGENVSADYQQIAEDQERVERNAWLESAISGNASQPAVPAAPTTVADDDPLADLINQPDDQSAERETVPHGEATIRDLIKGTPVEEKQEGLGDYLRRLVIDEGSIGKLRDGDILGALKIALPGQDPLTQELGEQVLGGAMDAFDAAGEVLQDLTGIGGVQLFDEETGDFDPDYLTADEWQERELQDSITGLFKGSDPENAPEAFVRATAKYLTGFIPALKATRAAGITGAFTSAMMAGAIADMVVFDPHEDRLSTFLNEIPALEPFVSDYLADNDPENESKWEGRFKNALEGAGLGLMTEAVGVLFRSFKYYKLQRQANSQLAAATAAGPDVQAQAGRDAIRNAARSDLVQDVTDDALRPLGDPTGPRVTIEDLADDAAKAADDVAEEVAEEVVDETAEAAARRIDEAATRVGQEGIYSTSERRITINHARINSPDDVKHVLQELADLDADAINLKRGGEVVTNEQTIKASSQEYRDLNDLIGREPGPMTAAQATAARRLLTSSGDQIVELARRAHMPDATPADLYNFRRAMAVHYAIQSEVIAARTETARALQAWAIPAGATRARSEAISELILNNGGAGDIQSLAKAVATVGDNPTALNAMAQELGRGRFGKALYQVWINGLLSSPKTHIVNMTSNAMVAAWSIPERFLQAGISKVFYGGDVKFGEAVSSAYGMLKGIRDGFRLIYHGNKAANIGDLNDVFDAFGKAEIRVNDISAEAFGMKPEGVFGRGIDLLGKIINVPGNLLQTEDKLFKSIGYRMELHAQAYRAAATEGLEGRAFAQRVADFIANPPEHIIADALDVAHYQTFTKALGPIGKKVLSGMNAIPGMRLVVPFRNTPTNIIKYTFERTPLAYMSSAIRADIRAGGPRASQAHARVAMGSMMMLVIGDMALDGTVTGRGPTDGRLRAAKMDSGWMPYSIKVGDRWYSYSRTDPIGMMMGLGADIAEILTNANDEENGEMLATAGALALANNLANKTYLTGIYDFIGAIDPSNPTNTPGKYLADFAGSIMPFSSFIRGVTGTADPIVRDDRTAIYNEEGQLDEVATYLEELLNRQRKIIPGLSDDLPPRIDLYGEEITRASGLGYVYDFLSPIASRVEDPDPVTKVIVDNQIAISNPPRIINGVRLNGEEYAEFSRLAGQPLKEFLDKMIASPGFERLSGGPDGMKSELIKDAVHNFRDRAKAIMMQKHPRLRELSFLRQQERMQTLQGTQ